MGLCSVWHFNGSCIESSQINISDMLRIFISVLTVTGARSNLIACMEEIIPKINEVIKGVSILSLYSCFKSIECSSWCS